MSTHANGKRRQSATNGPLPAMLEGLVDLLAERLADRLADTLASQPRETSAEDAKPDFYNEREAARRSNISVRTLQGWRGKGRGPRFVRAHRKVLYPRVEFETWLSESQ